MGGVVSLLLLELWWDYARGVFSPRECFPFPRPPLIIRAVDQSLPSNKAITMAITAHRTHSSIRICVGENSKRIEEQGTGETPRRCDS